MEEYSDIEIILKNKTSTESDPKLKDSQGVSGICSFYPNVLRYEMVVGKNLNSFNRLKCSVQDHLIRADLDFLLKIINAEHNADIILNKIKLSKLTENYQPFENIKSDEFNNLDILHLYSNCRVSGSETVHIHDTVLMDRYSFGSAINDIMLILNYLPTRKANSKICTLFDSTINPPISIKNYFARLSEFFLCSPSLFVLMFIYIKRIIENNPSCNFDSKNAHRLMLATLVISVKLYDDKLLPNTHYAHVGGVKESELSRLEVDVLLLMDFRLIVTIEEFVHFSYSLRLIGEIIKMHGIDFDDSNININDE